ncbi:MAG TPA: isoprenylcysteine carboxylmethyltransferase family protein [Dehalococcoidia bacterium]|nr:isoprenylcysteine carboxylmethyltransferase family protein [Dehalococcoidia bacterium]
MAIDDRYSLQTAPLVPARLPSHAGIRLLFHPREWNFQLDAGSVGLGLLIFWFAAVHLRLWIAHPGVFVGAGQVALEVVQGVLLFIRRRDRTGRRAPSVWLATTIGSWGFLLARPEGGAYFNAPALFGAQPFLGAEGLWLGVQLLGTTCAIASLTSLGRSFGLLAANRGVQTRGAYQVIRHPAYASYMLVQIGYVFENLSFWNLAVFCMVMVGQLTRIHQEEATLSQDPAYVRYCRQVRSRLVPGLF